MADVISLVARSVTAVSPAARSSSTSNNSRSSQNEIAATSGQAAALSFGSSVSVVGTSTGGALGSATLASLISQQDTGTGATTGAAGGGQTTQSASTPQTTTTEETETIVRNGQIVHVTRTIQIDANGARTVVRESSHVVYGMTLANLAYQNAQALTQPSTGTLLGVG